MLNSLRPGTALIVLLVCAAGALQSVTGDDQRGALRRDFQELVRPFLKTYCTGCHGGEQPKAKFDLSPYASLESVTGDLGHWKLVLERLRAEEMPPEEAKELPDRELRQRVVGWIERLRRDEAERNAGDPGVVLARRLSNAEYNYAIHDLTGVDIRPTREFPVDPANEAGFDNSGESLTMSPALLKKHLEAARHVADHLLLLPDGIDFAPHPVVVYSDRDKFCVHRIVDFYKRQPIDYADYFFAAWRYLHRADLGEPDATLEQIAETERVSPKYLKTMWAMLTDGEDGFGPIAELREKWQALPDQPTDAARAGCERLRDWVVGQRRVFIPPIGNYEYKPLSPSSQPLILWKDRDVAANRRRGKLPASNGNPDIEMLRSAIARFCATFPDTFFVEERGRMFEKEGLDKALDPSKRSTGRLLSAGFHLMLGYFRDDAPLYELILDRRQQLELDRMWRELDFVTEAPIRQFSDYIYFERAEGAAFLRAEEFDFAREDTDLSAQAKIQRLAPLYLAKARSAGIPEHVIKIIDAFFVETSANIKQLGKAQLAAEPAHRQALLAFAERAWQRPLTEGDRDELLAFYQLSREDLKLSHEDAVRDTLVSVLVSPRFCYRVTTAKPGTQHQALSDHELASRLSYFLWSSVPDDELRKQAEAGDLHDPEVLVEQTRRMLQDPRVRRLATEFGGHWLDFRRFESHHGVNRERFPSFTDELRAAMFEEPVRFLTDLVQRDGSVLEFIEAKHTFVNPVLAEHYGIPVSHNDPHQWVRIDDASPYGRGGLLPMSVFLTANSPGLRTSPVKRGYWVVRRLLGEQIPPPPPEVPELPKDESKLGELSVRDVLAKHRETKSCAVCHNRFDSIGLTFEGYGPIGERREKDLGGRAVDSSAVFPNKNEGEGIDGLRHYLRESRRDELIDNLCRKLLSYGLGRSLLLSDESTIEALKHRLVQNEFQFSSLVETIVTSPQFTHARGRDYSGHRQAKVLNSKNTGTLDE